MKPPICAFCLNEFVWICTTCRHCSACCTCYTESEGKLKVDENWVYWSTLLGMRAHRMAVESKPQASK